MKKKPKYENQGRGKGKGNGNGQEKLVIKKNMTKKAQKPIIIEKKK